MGIPITESSQVLSHAASTWELPFTGSGLTGATVTFQLLTANGQSVTLSPALDPDADNSEAKQTFLVIVTTAHKATLLNGSSSVVVYWVASITPAGGVATTGLKGQNYNGSFTLVKPNPTSAF